MERKNSFVRWLVVGVCVGVCVLVDGCGGLIRVGTAKDATPPVVRLATRPEFGVVPVTVSFDASATSDSESLISSYSWDFDGDGKEDSTAPVATFTYQQPGVYYPRLKVVNSEGLISYSTGSEIVANDKVYIRIETDKDVYKIGEIVKIRPTLVNASDEDFVYEPRSWPTTVLLIYNVTEEPVWKYQDIRASEVQPPFVELPAGYGVIPIQSPNYGLDWHQNYGYETADQNYDLLKKFPRAGIDIGAGGFYEYKGDIKKLELLEQVPSGLYYLKASMPKTKAWGQKKIKIIGDF